MLELKTLKCPWREFFFLNKPILIEEKIQKAQNTVFSGPKVLLFCLKSVSWTGNELAGDNVENCEHFQLSRLL